MSEGPKRTTTVGRTMRNGQTIEVDIPTAGKVRFTVRDHRCRVYLDLPPGAVVSEADDRNLDDLDDR